MTGAVLEFIAFVALLMLGAAGWGNLAVRVAGVGSSDAPELIGGPLRILIGFAVSLALGGILVALGVASFPVLVAFQALGVAILLAGAPWREGRSGWKTAGRRWAGWLPLTPLYALFATLCLATALGTLFYNIDDDDPAYIYLAQRLLDTGGLIDPFNQRRLASYGGSTLYQAMFLRVSGNTALRGFEFFFAVVLLITLVLRTNRRRWLVVGGLVLGIGVILGDGVGHIANLSPAYSAAALSLGVYQLLVLASASRNPTRLYALVGVVLAGLLSLRFTYAISVGAALLLTIAVVGGPGLRRRMVALAATVGATVLCSVGWAVAAYRSSGTPLFPLVLGNYVRSFPSGPDPSIRTLSQYWQRFQLAFGYDHLGWVMAVAGVGAALLAATKPARRREGVILATAALGCLLQLIVFTHEFSGSAIAEVSRFEAPSILACGLLGVDLLWPIRAAGLPTEGRVAQRSHARRRRGLASLVARAAPELVFGVAAVAIAAAAFGYAPATYWPQTWNELQLGGEVGTGSAGLIDRFASLRPVYDALDAAIPAHARVLAAVDEPSLLDMRKFDVATLDIVGSVSPPRHLPLFSSVADIVSYLRRQGFAAVVVESSADPGLYNIASWLANYDQPVYNYKAWAPYFVRWNKVVNALERDGRYYVKTDQYLTIIYLTRQPGSSVRQVG